MKKLRMTRQRKIILSVVQNELNHPGAFEIYQQVRKQLPRVSLGTVYRNLHVLVETGQIARLEQSGQQTRFDGNPNKHVHMRCQGCGNIDDMFHAMLDQFIDELRQSTDFAIRDYHLEFLGLCPQCQQG